MVNGNAAISDHIQGILKDNKVVIFGTSHCAYAKKARQALVEDQIFRIVFKGCMSKSKFVVQISYTK